MSAKSIKNFQYAVIYLLLILGSIFMVLPFFWSLITSLKTLTESLLVPPTLWPKAFTLENYTNIWHDLPFIYFFKNSVIMIVARIFFAIIFSTMAGYAYARMDFPFKNFLFILILIPMMIPPQIYILPQYLIVSKLHLANTVTALVIPGIVSTFGTFLLRQFFMSIPDELEEAAILDGCNYGQILWYIMMPIAKSALVSLGIFTSLFAWKDLMWPLIVNMSPEKMPFSSGLALLQGQYFTNFPELMAGSMIAILFMIVLFVAFQKQFVEGIATTGSK